MTWIRNGSFPLVPSGLEINFSLRSDDGRQIWITVKSEDAQATERLAETILRCLNPTAVVAPDHSVHVEPDHSLQFVPEVAEVR